MVIKLCIIIAVTSGLNGCAGRDESMTEPSSASRVPRITVADSGKGPRMEGKRGTNCRTNSTTKTREKLVDANLLDGLSGIKVEIESVILPGLEVWPRPMQVREAAERVRRVVESLEPLVDVFDNRVRGVMEDFCSELESWFLLTGSMMCTLLA